MKNILALIIVLLSFSTIHAQSIEKDAQGNYHVVKKSKPDSLTSTGKTFTDGQGRKYPIYQGSRGGLFVVITKEDGTTYKKYLPKD